MVLGFLGWWRMNTTELICHWSMSGADRDIARRFRSGTDIREAITTEARGDQPMPERGELLVKQADADDWTLLATG